MPKTELQSLKNLMQSLQKPSEESKQVPTMQLVIFEIDSEKYGVEITDLKEIIVASEVTTLPNSPNYVRGIMNLRGRIVAIIDLMARINLPGYQEGKNRNKILITEVENDLYGIEIDEVLRIQLVENSAIKPAPTVILNKIKADQSIKGVVLLEAEQNKKDQQQEPELVIIFDLKKLITTNNTISS